MGLVGCGGGSYPKSCFHVSLLTHLGRFAEIHLTNPIHTMAELQNTIDKEFTADELKKLDDALTVLEEVTKDFPVLTPKEKARRVKAPDNSQGWRGNMAVRAEQNLDSLPRSFDLAKVKRDLKLETDLEPRDLRLRRIVDRIDSAAFLAASDSFSASLFIRRQLKSLGVAGVDDGMDEGLESFFKRGGEDEAPPPVPPAK
jgi:hypothetical protein